MTHIAPKYREQDVFTYQLEISDVFPSGQTEKKTPNKKKPDLKSRFRFSLKVLNRTKDYLLFEWSYLPVKDPIVEFFTSNKNYHYGFTHDIKQNLKFVYSTTNEGEFGELENENEMLVQLGTIIDSHMDDNSRYEKMNPEARKNLREGMLHDKYLLNDVLDFHMLYGKTILGGKLYDGNELVMQENDSLIDHSTRIFQIDKRIIVDHNSTELLDNSISKNKKRICNIRWKLDNDKMIIREMYKNVVLTSAEGNREFGIKFEAL